MGRWRKGVEGGKMVDALVMMDNTPVMGSRNGGYFMV